MVYCDFVSQNDNKVRYRYGGYTDDVTGVVDFDIDGGGFSIEKEPERNLPYLPVYLMKLYCNKASLFKKAEFPQKLSYEI